METASTMHSSRDETWEERLSTAGEAANKADRKTSIA